MSHDKLTCNLTSMPYLSLQNPMLLLASRAGMRQQILRSKIKEDIMEIIHSATGYRRPKLQKYYKNQVENKNLERSLVEAYQISTRTRKTPRATTLHWNR